MVKKYLIGFLTLVVLSASIYIYLEGQVKINVGSSSTTFSIWNETKWQVSGVEYSKIFNGTKLIRFSRALTFSQNSVNFTNITRTSVYKDILLIDNYQFDGNIKDKEMFPIAETHEVTGAKGMIYQYEVRKLPYSGENLDLLGKNEFTAGKMKIEWQPGNYYAKVTTTRTGGKLIVKYRITSNDETFNIRLFDPDVSACGNLDTANAVYTLTANVSSADYCFHIIANNVTLNGNGYWINYSQSATGHAINNTGGYDNITLKNLNIVQGSTLANSYAIYVSGMENGTITNNTIRTSGTDAYGILLYSSSNSNILSNNTISTSGGYGYGINFDSSSTNTLSNNTISTSGGYGYGIRIISSSNSNILSNNTISTSGGSGYGIYLGLSSTNNITGGSIISKLSFDYYWRDTGTTNNVTNTNFTAQRRIYFYDVTSYFNYNNETTGNIWLKTNVSAASSLNRTLATWSQSQMRWNDTNSTAGITANYNITGLYTNTLYRIYNSSKAGTSNLFNITSDGNGALNFAITLNDNTELKGESVSSPRWSNNITSPNSPQIYSTANNYGFQINWTDLDGNFANASFQLGRLSGSLTNYTIATTPATLNNSASGKDVWFINFTQNQFGGVGVYNYTWFGTDLTGLQNKTDTIDYTINKAVLSLTIASNGTQTYPFTSTAEGSETNSGDSDITYWLSRNSSMKDSTSPYFETAQLGAGVYNYTFNTSSTSYENYTANASGVSVLLIINKGTSVAQLWLNGSLANQTYYNDQVWNMTVSCGNGVGQAGFYLNATGFGNNFSSGAGPFSNFSRANVYHTDTNYNASGVCFESVNWTQSQDSSFINVEPGIDFYLNATLTFSPNSSTQYNVEPYYQSASRPAVCVNNTRPGTSKNISFYTVVNYSTLYNTTLFASATYSASSSQKLGMESNESWLFNNTPANAPKCLYIWANFSRGVPGLWNPDLYADSRIS